MAIVTDQTITIHGVSVGISKPIQTLIANGDFTYTELSKFAFVGRHDFVNDVAGIFDNYSWSRGDSETIATEDKFPVLNDPEGNWDTVKYVYYGKCNRPYDNYGKMVLVYNMVNSDNNITSSFNDNNSACIVTEINPRLLKQKATLYPDSVTANVGETGSYTVYDSDLNSIVWYDDDTAAPFKALEIQQFENANFYVFPLYNNIFISYQDINGNKSGTNAMMQFMIGDYAGTADTFISWWRNSAAIQDFLQGADYSGSFTGVNDLSNGRSDAILTVAYGSFAGVIRCRASSVDTALKQVAGTGLYFEVNNVVYKPVTEGGIVTGYTADLTKNSEWDLINDVTGNTVPDTPGGGGGGGSDEDNDDPITTIDAPFGSGLAHYYVTTAGSVVLEHVSEALGTWDIDTSKKDLYRNLISCKLIKPPAAIPTSGSENFTIYGVQPQYQGSPVLLPVVSGNPSASFGPFSISRKFNDFRDFAPYSKAEIFLPYCGWTALPSHVIGRSVSVKYFTDIIAATCKAVVFCGNNVVAEAAGVIGLDIPFASENVGAKMEAANMGLLASTLGAVQTAVGVGTMVSTKSGSGLKNVTQGLSQVISGCTQISMAGNENWTEINGKAGDGCSLSGINNIIIKITRPKYGSNVTPPYVPSGYAHNIGYVSMKQTKPGSITGLLVCDNVDTSGISGATERERNLIKAYLESGIIVNAAPSP